MRSTSLSSRTPFLGGYQLDHIKTVWECFKLKIAPEEAASLNNLRMLPWREM